MQLSAKLLIFRHFSHIRKYYFEDKIAALATGNQKYSPILCASVQSARKLFKFLFKSARKCIAVG